MATPKKVKLLVTLKAGVDTFPEGKVYEGEKIPEVVLAEVEAGASTVKVLEYEKESAPASEPAPKEEDPVKKEEKPAETKRVTKTSTSTKK